ncbi:hypothetical protein [Hyphomonas sp.]|uniref:hypothetical protein n=1 Tax=Hyphomonas sp. TaxID=87 RepID=UPI003568D0CE
MKRPFSREKLFEMSHTPKDPAKAIRRAEALRANLKRRKAAVRKTRDDSPPLADDKRE